MIENPYVSHDCLMGDLGDDGHCLVCNRDHRPLLEQFEKHLAVLEFTSQAGRN